MSAQKLQIAPSLPVMSLVTSCRDFPQKLQTKSEDSFLKGSYSVGLIVQLLPKHSWITSFSDN